MRVLFLTNFYQTHGSGGSKWWKAYVSFRLAGAQE
jgi:hypothetical protein